MCKPFYLFLLLTIVFCSCKKDLLHYQSIQRLPSYSDSDRLNKIFFINDSIGFIVGGLRFYDALILRTKDGGHTWQRQSFPAAGKGIYDICISSSGVLATISFEGKLLRSNDTGKTWHFNQLLYDPYSGIAFTDPGNLLIVGGISFSSGTRLFMDTNLHLVKRDSFAYQFNKVYMNGPTGYLCGFGIVEKTTDGGRTWSFQGALHDNFTCMDIHGNEIWMCGSNGGVYHTYDGGEHWQQFRNGNDITLPKYRLNGIAFKDAQNGWAVGDEGKVIHSDDGGRHWAEYDKFTGNNLNSVAVCPNGDLLIAGDNGMLCRVVPR